MPPGIVEPPLGHFVDVQSLPPEGEDHSPVQLRKNIVISDIFYPWDDIASQELTGWDRHHKRQSAA